MDNILIYQNNELLFTQILRKRLHFHLKFYAAKMIFLCIQMIPDKPLGFCNKSIDSKTPRPLNSWI